MVLVVDRDNPDHLAALNYSRFAHNLHAIVRGDLQGPPRHSDTVAGPFPGRICHSHTLHPRKIADRNLPPPRGAELALWRADRAHVPDVLLGADLVFGAELTKAIADERRAAPAPPQRGTIQHRVSSS